VRTGVSVNGHEPHEGGTTVLFGEGERVDVDAVIVSVGRRPTQTGSSATLRAWNSTSAALSMSTSGCAREPTGYSPSATSLPPAARARRICRGNPRHQRDLEEPAVPVDYSKVPWCIYCHPEVAFVGMTEEGARAAGYEVVVQKDPSAEMAGEDRR